MNAPAASCFGGNRIFIDLVSCEQIAVIAVSVGNQDVASGVWLPPLVNQATTHCAVHHDGAFAHVSDCGRPSRNPTHHGHRFGKFGALVDQVQPTRWVIVASDDVSRPAPYAAFTLHTGSRPVPVPLK
jgi:hypothetical protein